MSKIGFTRVGIKGTPTAGHEGYLFSIPSVPKVLVRASEMMANFEIGK